MRIEHRQSRSAHRVLGCLLLGWVGTACALAQTPPDGSPDDYAAAEAVVVTPTQGRPVFVAPGGLFRAVAQLPPAPAGLRFTLVSAAFPQHRHPLVPQEADDAGDRAQFDLTVPPETPEQTYDLEVAWDGGALTSRHAVAVRRVGRRVRLVHLSNMNVGEIGVPDFDERLIAEVNLLAPTLIVATGDLIDATHDDPERGWSRCADFLGRFHAPTLVACGDHDGVGLYSKYMAPSAIGAIDVGPYRGLVLYDVPSKPIVLDDVQTRWVAGELSGSTSALTFVVAHDQCPSLLRYWQQQGTLAETVHGGRLAVWFAGGHRDWDGREYRSIVQAAEPMLYVRTREASSATRDGAAGVSHYRVLDLDREQVRLYGEPNASGLPASIAVGRLNVSCDGPNDGSRRQVTMTVTSALPFRLDDLTARVLVQRSGAGHPWCHGARLERLVELSGMWECWLKFDLPDKGARRMVVGTGQAPKEPRIDVRFDMPQELVLRPVASQDGVTYLTAGQPGLLMEPDTESGTCGTAALGCVPPPPSRGRLGHMNNPDQWSGTVRLQNSGSHAVAVTPIIRLDGEPIAYSVSEESGPVATAYCLRLEPARMLALQLDLSAVRVAPGRRELQVYLKGGSALVPACLALDVTVSE